MKHSAERIPVIHETRRASSYLVRLWHEGADPSDWSNLRGGSSGDVRGFVRNLATGTERYFVDSTQLAEILGMDCHESMPAPRRSGAEERSEKARVLEPVGG